MKTKLLLIPLVLFALACGDENPVAPEPVACFSYTPETAIKAGDEITFTNCSENATAYSWDFGDGNTSIEENPVHTYIQEGTYTVTLTSTGDGEENIITKDVIIEAVAGYIKVNGNIIITLKASTFSGGGSWETDETGRFHELMLWENILDKDWDGTGKPLGKWGQIVIITDANNVKVLEGTYNNDPTWTDGADARTAPDYSIDNVDVYSIVNDWNSGYYYWNDIENGQKLQNFVINKMEDSTYEIIGSIIMSYYNADDEINTHNYEIEIYYKGVLPEHVW